MSLSPPRNIDLENHLLQYFRTLFSKYAWDIFLLDCPSTGGIFTYMLQDIHSLFSFHLLRFHAHVPIFVFLQG
jgi:hypothetical protein